MDHDWHGAIDRARKYSPFLARVLDRQPEIEAILTIGDGEAALAWARSLGEDEEIAVALRRQRLALAGVLAIGDLAGAFSLSRVVSELTNFADYALDRAILVAIAERTGEARSDGFLGLALGKQGGGELNYSSDIDPILLYDRKRLPCRKSDDPGEAAQRYARRIVKILSESTPEGYVLRVDLRLRPASEISPLVVPVGTALTHYQGQALAWERAAFIRARAAAGDVPAGEAFLQEISPFVWRQALDFGAVAEIRALTKRIRESNEGAAEPGPGFDVKRGRGGIREIEFFAQTHQLIHGGRDPSLRVRGTSDALFALADAGRIAHATAGELSVAYKRLRVIEHRLQMLHDRQTHSLPEGEALDAVAKLDGLPDGASLIAELKAITDRTATIYESLILDDQTPIRTTPPPSEQEQWLASLGFADPAELSARIKNWSDGRYASVRSPQATEAFDRLLPSLLEAFAQSSDPDRAITRWQSILERAPTAITLFRLLVAKPDLLGRLVAALTLSPLLADQLGRRPELLDALFDPTPVELSSLYETKLQEMIQGSLRDDYEARLDQVRHVTSEQRFSLGISLIEGEIAPSCIGAALSHTAEAAIAVATEAASREFARVHGEIAGAELIVLGLGRLGGGALTHASDLDMIYLFTGAFSSESDGQRPLGATLYFNRLASRVSAALSVPTAQGSLYEVDTRLRPQGNQGPLAVSLDAFAKYQRETAWTWEHMALTRARVLVGSPQARREADEIIHDVLTKQRDQAEVRQSVLSMREEIAQHKPSRGPLDVKLMRGGLVDVEFLVHCLQLQNGHRLASEARELFNPDLPTAIRALQRHGLIEDDLLPAYLLLTDILVSGRLLAPDGQEPPPAAASALAKACGRDGYSELARDLAVARMNVAAAWQSMFNQRLELDNE